jgi:CheY-like chemotaxis protein
MWSWRGSCSPYPSMRSFVDTRSGAVTSSRTIVFVDAHDDFRDITTLLLRAHGHHVFEASDGMRGLELIEQHRPNVALVDLYLPGMSGCEIAKRVRSQPTFDGTILVCMSSSSARADIERAIAAGFDFYRVKTTGMEGLEDAIRGSTGSRD